MAVQRTKRPEIKPRILEWHYEIGVILQRRQKLQNVNLEKEGGLVCTESNF